MPAAKKPDVIDVATAAERLGVAKTTVWGMVKRGELTIVGYANDGESAAGGSRARMLLDAAEVDKAPHGRRRGHPKAEVGKLRGAAYARLRAGGKSPADIARKYNVSRQAVADALARFDAAQQPKATRKSR